MTPYLASLGWYGGFFAGNPPAPAKQRWNRAFISAKQYSAGDNMLTIPVRGGVRVVKNVNPADWQADERRNWRHIHIGALAAAYGRTPFYRHFAPAVNDIISDTSITGIGDIAEKLDYVVRESLAVSEFENAIKGASPQTVERALKYGGEIAGQCNPALSMMHYIFHYGKDAIFLLARAFVLLQEEK